MVTFKLEKDAKGFHAWSPELPGVHTHGATHSTALANLKDAVRLYLDDVMEEFLLSSVMAGLDPAIHRESVRER